MPKISVIVPIYNVEPYVAQCLESLLGQSLSDIEIICIDDCGTDRSMDVVNEFAQHDNRIKVFHHPENRGLSASRNTGLENGSAEYFMFCDSDDWYAPNMCEKLYNAIEQSGADVAMCGTELIYEPYKPEDGMRSADERYFAIDATGHFDVDRTFRCNKPVVVVNKIYRRSIIEENECRFPIGLKYEDEYFWRAYSMWCKTIYTLTDKLYYYRRIRPGSIMHQTLNHAVISGGDAVLIGIRYYDYLCRHISDKTSKYYNEFWTFLWPKLVNSAVYRCRDYKDAMAKIQQDVYEFINKHYVFGIYDFQTDCQISKMKFLGQRFYEKSFLCLNIPVWTVRYYQDYKRYYLFRHLPVLRIRMNKNKKTYLLFSVLPLLSIQRKPETRKCAWRLFGCVLIFTSKQ